MKIALLKSVSFAALLIALSTPSWAQEKDPIVASVNDKKIMFSEVVNLQKTLPEEYKSLPADKLLPLLVQMVIESTLVEGAAKNATGTFTAEQKKALDAAIGKATLYVQSQFYIDTLNQKAVTNDKVQEAYKKFVEDFPPTEERKVSWIIVKDKATALGIIKALKNGQDFQKLARAKSTDAESAKEGGRIGFMRKEDLKDLPALAEDLFSLPVGDYTPDPLETHLGWHVCKIDEKREASPPSLEEVEKMIKQKVANEALSTIIDDLRSKAKIVFYDKDGKPLAPKKPAEQKKSAAEALKKKEQ